MTTLFVIAGHGAGDPGACAYGFSEAERVRALAQRIKDIGGGSVELGDFSRDYYADGGISNLGIPKDWQIVELHMDSASASARGGHVIIKDGFDPDSYDNALANFIGRMFPGRSVLITPRSDLANPNRAAAAGYPYRLLECCFISNYDDLMKFNNQMDDLARGILNAFGIATEKPKRNMSEAAMQGIGNQAYTGGECCPAMVSGAGATFDTSWRDNVNVGWGTAVATGNGDWVGVAEVPFKILPQCLVSYQDIEPTAWYVDVARQAVEQGIMVGSSYETWEPDVPMIRAQAVCVIYNAAGMVNDPLPYDDIEQAPWYHDALEWATEQGIVSGFDGKFRPGDACSREEFATMLWNWRGKPEFELAADCSDWAAQAISWAVANDIMGNGGVRPYDACTRAEAAAMVLRAKEL